jgi:hypothetical protein
LETGWGKSFLSASDHERSNCCISIDIHPLIFSTSSLRMENLSRRNNRQWLLLGLAWLVALGLGAYGFARYLDGSSTGYSIWDDLYRALQLIPMHSGGIEPPIPFSLNIARFLIPLLAGATAIKALWQVFRQQIRAAQLNRLRDQVIICGLSRKGELLASQFRRQGTKVVVIERDEANHWLESCRQQGMFVLTGDASDATLLRAAGVARARGLFAVCDDDGLNLEIALRTQELVQDRKGEPLTCLVHVSDPQLCALLREHEASLERAPFRLEMFNVFERGARRMLQDHPAWPEGAGKPAAAPKILIVGLGRMGENLLLHAARDWWNQNPEKSNRLQVTIIDRHADHKVEMLHVCYPQLGAACLLVPLAMDIFSAEYERADFLSDGEGKPAVDMIYICVDSDSLGLHAGLTLRRRMHTDPVPVVVRMTEITGLARLLANRKNPGTAYHNLFAFGYLNRTCTPELLKATLRGTLARATHEEYVATQLRAGRTAADDPALQPWEQLDTRYQEANYQWVDRITLLIKSIGCQIVPLIDWDAPSFQFTPQEVDQMARMEHEHWMQQRLQDGWTFASRPKDLGKKIHPDLVPWQDLPECEKEKNLAAVADIPRFLAVAGFQVERKWLAGNSFQG